MLPNAGRRAPPGPQKAPRRSNFAAFWRCSAAPPQPHARAAAAPVQHTELSSRPCSSARRHPGSLPPQRAPFQISATSPMTRGNQRNKARMGETGKLAARARQLRARGTRDGAACASCAACLTMYCDMPDTGTRLDLPLHTPGRVPAQAKEAHADLMGRHEVASPPFGDPSTPGHLPVPDGDAPQGARYRAPVGADGAALCHEPDGSRAPPRRSECGHREQDLDRQLRVSLLQH